MNYSTMGQPRIYLIVEDLDEYTLIGAYDYYLKGLQENCVRFLVSERQLASRSQRLACFVDVPIQ